METSTEFRGTSAFTGNGCDRTQSTRKEMTCLLRKLYVHTKSDRENQNVNSLGRNPSCQTRSKTLEMLSETRCVSPWLLSEADQELTQRPVDCPLDEEIGNHIWEWLSSLSHSRNESSWP